MRDRLADSIGPIAVTAKLGEIDLTDGNMVLKRIDITNESDADDRVGYGIIVDDFEVYEADSEGDYAIASIGALSAEGTFAIVSDKKFNAILLTVGTAASTDLTKLEFLGEGNESSVHGLRLVADDVSATGAKLQVIATDPNKLDVATAGLPAGKYVLEVTVPAITLSAIKLAHVTNTAIIATDSTLIDEPFIKTAPDENKIAIISGGDVTVAIQHSR